MRVPWRDRPWDEFLCDDPLGNSSCTLLAAIGKGRDDTYEVTHSSAEIDTLEHDRLPCLSERATFMSPLGYSVVKEHPYRHNRALKDKLHATMVSVPGYSFEAVPFRWMNRKSFADEIGFERVPDFDQSAEDAADRALKYEPPWVMDGDNQRAVLAAFFEQVSPNDSLVFIYLKHSPLQEQRTDRLLVGAARIKRLSPPPMWKQSGNPPFLSSMWETIVEHTLRPDMVDGILLPYQELVPLLDDGIDVDSALAWAPEGRDIEFSYVTEHLSDDAAIEALTSLQSASTGMQALGLPVPEAGIQWLQAQIERLWQLRGPVPGLPGVLAVIGVQQPHMAARCVITEAAESDPWQFLDDIFAAPRTAPEVMKPHIGTVQARIWTKLSAEERSVLRLLSGLDVSADQVRMLLDGNTEVEMSLDELLDNPYFASTCTYGTPSHVPFTTVDRALFPPSYVSWTSPIPADVHFDGPLDRRRIEALLTDILENRGRKGDTVVPSGEVVDLANQLPLAQPPNLTNIIMTGLDLDHAGITDWNDWSPLTSILLTDDITGLKLRRFEDTSAVIRLWITHQQNLPTLGKIEDSRRVLDAALDRNKNVTGEIDESEERARTEKSAGLSALHDAPLSVLIGPAGTGKTTLLRSLVEYSGVNVGSVLLLAPTGKAKVQLETKVGLPAKTLASFLSATNRYEGETGRYIVWGKDRPRNNCGLVVIDEASMLTEEMLAATLDAFTAIKRLILVGDPRQLPPIGAGRPFVDLVNKLRPESFADWVRVAPGYVELQIPRRQLADGSHGERHDLELAAWFGDNLRGAGDEEIWSELSANPDLPTVKYVPWASRSAVDVLVDELRANLDLDGDPDAARAFALTYGGLVSGKYLNWQRGAGIHAEDWQILSPSRSRAFGTVELNRHIKRTYRAEDTRWSQRYNDRGNIPKPIGPELIVRGDKVMQTTNKRMRAYPKPDAMNYVANGEIGVAIGYVMPAWKRKKEDLKLEVEFSSQPGYQYSYWPSDKDDALLELAWAVTVHKSQGSEFGTTFLMLPARANISRELMYTALTRQRDKVVILHDGTLADLRDLAQPWRSETARRLTDLFEVPEPVDLTIRGATQRFDRKLIHVSANGTPMASKNEVIIASLLDQLVPGRWQYEEPFLGGDGRAVRPDFTIATDDGRTVFWEHAGMLDLTDYARKWELKKAWYSENQVLPHSAGGGANGTLMWTDDLAGADASAWLVLASEVLGATPVVHAGGTRTDDRRGRRTAKKSQPRERR